MKRARRLIWKNVSTDELQYVFSYTCGSNNNFIRPGERKSPSSIFARSSRKIGEKIRPASRNNLRVGCQSEGRLNWKCEGFAAARSASRTSRLPRILPNVSETSIRKLLLWRDIDARDNATRGIIFQESALASSMARRPDCDLSISRTRTSIMRDAVKLESGDGGEEW